MGVAIRENPHRAIRESCDVGGASHGAEGWGAIAPEPRSAGQPSVAGERCCKLLLESTEESQATTTSSVVPHEPAGRRRRSRDRLERGGLARRRYQPDWPMTNRPPATYRDSTITSQPKPPNKNKSRNDRFADASRDTRPDAPHHVSNARRHRQPARHRASHREDARPKHLQETRGHQTSRSSEASRERGPPAGWRRAR